MRETDSALASLEHIVTLALSWRSCSWPWALIHRHRRGWPSMI